MREEEGRGGEGWGERGEERERERERERGRGERMEGMVRGGGGGKREGGKGGTNWSRDCTLQKPLSTVAVSSTSCGQSHMIPTRNSLSKITRSYILIISPSTVYEALQS